MAVNRIDITDLMGKSDDEGKEYDLLMPEEVNLCCPKCGSGLRDRGKCKVKLIRETTVDSISGCMLELLVQCDECKYIGTEVGA